MPRPRKPNLTLVTGSPPDPPDPPSPSGSLVPLAGITAANYAQRGKAFIEANGGKAFLVCPEPRRLQGEEFPATPAQWDAWLSFFQRKRIKHSGMLERGYYTVPAEWPSQFCAD